MTQKSAMKNMGYRRERHSKSFQTIGFAQFAAQPKTSL
jgi:hypothetical protein